MLKNADLIKHNRTSITQTPGLILKYFCYFSLYIFHSDTIKANNEDFYDKLKKNEESKVSNLKLDIIRPYFCSRQFPLIFNLVQKWFTHLSGKGFLILRKRKFVVTISFFN